METKFSNRGTGSGFDTSASGVDTAKPVTYWVWASSLWLSLNIAIKAGMNVESVFEGLPFDQQTIRKQHRIEWSDYVTACERLTELAGGLDRAESFMATEYLLSTKRVRYVAGAVSPMTLIKLLTDFVLPAQFQSCQFAFTSLGPRRALVTATLRSGARPCLAWFRGLRGHLRTLPQHLGLEPAKVTGDVGSTHGEYDISTPASESLAERLGRVYQRLTLRTLIGADEEGNPVAAKFGNHADDDVLGRVEDLAERWDLTERQARVLQFVAEGASNKEIALALHCAENTVEFHVTQLLRKASVPTRTRLIATIWAGPSTGSP